MIHETNLSKSTLCLDIPRQTWQTLVMINYQTRNHTVICSLCSEEIKPGQLFQLDDHLDAEDGTACIPCVEEIEAEYAEQDGDFQRKFALEA